MAADDHKHMSNGQCCGQKPTAGAHDHAHHGHAGHHHGATAGERVKDPVCGMEVDPATSRHRHDHAGTTYHFCSDGCRTKFVADPARTLAPAKAEPAAAPEGTVFTCPMHP